MLDEYLSTAWVGQTVEQSVGSSKARALNPSLFDSLAKALGYFSTQGF